MKEKTSITSKLIIYFLCLNLLAVLIVGSYSYYKAKNALFNRTFDQLTSLRIEKKYRIERFFEDRILDLKLIAKSEDVHNIIEVLQDKNDSASAYKNIYTIYDTFLSKHFFSRNFYKRLYVSTINEKTVSFTPLSPDSTSLHMNRVDSFSINKLWKKLINENTVVVKDYIIDDGTNLPGIFIGTSIINKTGKIIGVVVIEIEINAINSIMFEANPHNGLGKSGESYLVGNDYLMRSTSRFVDNSVFNTYVDTKGVRKALNGNTGTSIIKDYRGISVLSSYSTVDIQGLHWAVLAEIDEEEAMVPIKSIRNNIIYLGLIISLFLFAFVYLIARKISRPIVKLKEAAEKITEGDYNVAVEDIDSNDEIANLIDAFNEMSKKIKEQTENLKLERTMRLSSMIDGQEMERQRLSRELHDGLGQTILALKMRLEKLKSASPEKRKEILDNVTSVFTDIINEIRNISSNLMPAILNEFGLSDALENLCKEVSGSTGIVFNLDISKKLDINNKIRTYLYRISQEAINNIIKHSEADKVDIRLTISNNTIQFSIADNGRGFLYSKGQKLCGNGISNIKERVHLLNGSINLNTSEGKGTQINIQIPLNNKNGKNQDHHSG